MRAGGSALHRASNARAQASVTLTPRRLAASQGDTDVEAEVSFLVLDTSAEREELCYATIDLSQLRTDLVREWIDAKDSTSSQTLGRFNVTVQAIAAVQRARRAP